MSSRSSSPLREPRRSRVVPFAALVGVVVALLARAGAARRTRRRPPAARRDHGCRRRRHPHDGRGRRDRRQRRVVGRRRRRRAGALRPRQRARRRGGTHDRVRERVTPPTPPTVAATVFAVVPAVERRARPRRAGAARESRSSAPRRRPGGTRTGRVRVRRRAGRAADRAWSSPAWGAQLRSLLGTAQGSQVAVAVDDDALGAARAEQARRSLRAAGFTVAAPVTLPAPPAPLPDLAPVATTLHRATPAVVLLLTSPLTTAGLAQQLARLGFTGTVATSDAFYQPTTPAVGERPHRARAVRAVRAGDRGQPAAGRRRRVVRRRAPR